MAVIYLNNMAAIYLNEIVNLLELKNQRGIRFSRPEIFKRLGGIIKKTINRPIHSGVNKKL